MIDAKYPIVIFGNAIGDHLLVLPAIRALGEIFAGRLSLICHPLAKQSFFNDIAFRGVYEVNMSLIPSVGEDRYVQYFRTFDSAHLIEAIQNCDLLISLNTCWHSKAIKVLLEGLAPANSIGFYSAFQVTLTLDSDKHAVDTAFEVPKYLDHGLTPEQFSTPPSLPLSAIQKARAFKHSLSSGVKVLAVHADTKKDKTWPRAKWVKLLDLFLDRHQEYIAVIVGQHDYQLATGKHHKRVLPCYGLPLSLSMALVSEADMFVGVDSCMLHVADFFRAPGVGLFSPTHFTRWGFRFGPHRHIYSKESMSAIDDVEVMDAIESLMK